MVPGSVFAPCSYLNIWETGNLEEEIVSRGGGVGGVNTFLKSVFLGCKFKEYFITRVFFFWEEGGRIWKFSSV